MERFVVEGRLRWMTWEQAEASRLRKKTSLALTRKRARDAMQFATIQTKRRSSGFRFAYQGGIVWFPCQTKGFRFAYQGGIVWFP